MTGVEVIELCVAPLKSGSFPVGHQVPNLGLTRSNRLPFNYLHDLLPCPSRLSTLLLQGCDTAKMVRIKERYLLVDIVYPEAAQDQAKAGLPDLLFYNQPTVNACNARSIQYAIKAQITDLFGDFGAGAVERSLRGLLLLPFGSSAKLTDPTVKYLSNATSTCILQCSREHYRLVWAALTMMKHVPTKQGVGLPCIFRVVRVSGTIKKVEEEAIRRAKQLILAAKDEMAGKETNALSTLFGASDSANDVAMIGRSEDSDHDSGDSEGDD